MAQAKELGEPAIEHDGCQPVDAERTGLRHDLRKAAVARGKADGVPVLQAAPVVQFIRPDGPGI